MYIIYIIPTHVHDYVKQLCKKCKYLSLADVAIRRSSLLLRGLLLTGKNHSTIAHSYQPSFQRRWQRTACVVFFVTTTSGVDAENVDKNDRQAYDERQQRPKHTVHDCRLRHHVQYHVTRIVGVSKAEISGAGVAIFLGKTLHRSHVVLGDTVALVK